MPTVALVLNEKSGALLSNQGGPETLSSALRTAGFDITDIPPGELPDRLHQARHSGAALVVVGGGDGTVACAAQALAGTDVTLGILPAGTANLLAKDLGITPGDAAEAVRILAEGRARRIDVAEIENHVFLCAAMFGSPARLGHHRETGRKRGNGLAGWLHFAGAAIRAARRHKARRLTVTLDGVRHQFRTPSLTIVVNELDDSSAHLFGRKCLDGGALWLYVVRRTTIFGYVRMAGNALRGRFANDPSVQVLHGRAVQVEGNDAALRVLIDGEERLLQTPVHVRLSDRKLRIMAAA